MHEQRLAKVVDKLDDIVKRIIALEKTPPPNLLAHAFHQARNPDLTKAPLPEWLTPPKKPGMREPLDPRKVLDALLADPELGEKTRLKMKQLEEDFAG